MTTLIYLHGFLSSPRSAKAQLLRDFVARSRGVDGSAQTAVAPEQSLTAPEAALRVSVPLLPDRPAAALAAAEAAVTAALASGPVGLVGSSMGGFYATVLAARYGLRCVLINPAVEPHRHLWRFFDEPVCNPYTGAVIQLGEADAEALKAMLEGAALSPGSLSERDRIWLLVQMGDEVLDYRKAVAWYAGCRQTVEPGGDHQFQGFDRQLPEVVKFLQCGADND